MGEADGAPLLPALLLEASNRLASPEGLDQSGMAQFHLYQTLYGLDVEKPRVEVEAKQAVPLWIQKRLHERWLGSICVIGQPQGSEALQMSVDACLQRTN